MKKTLVFISLALLISLALTLSFCGDDPQTFRVEKAYKAQADGKVITAGQTINENSTIIIGNDGYILFVDSQNKKRYYINTSCNLKLSELIGKAKAPMQVTMSYLESLFTKNQNEKYTSAGSVNRGEGEDGSPSVFIPGAERLDSAGKPIGANDTTAADETIYLYHIIP